MHCSLFCQNKNVRWWCSGSKDEGMQKTPRFSPRKPEGLAGEMQYHDKGQGLHSGVFASRLQQFFQRNQSGFVVPEDGSLERVYFRRPARLRPIGKIFLQARTDTETRLARVSIPNSLFYYGRGIESPPELIEPKNFFIATIKRSCSVYRTEWFMRFHPGNENIDK